MHTYIQQRVPSFGKDGDRTDSYVAGGSVKYYSHSGGASQFLIKMHLQLPCDPAIPLVDVYLKK